MAQEGPMMAGKEELEKLWSLEDSTHHYIDAEDDMEKGENVFFYNALHTPPGAPFLPMTDYLQMQYVARGTALAHDKLADPFCRCCRCKSLRGYFYTSPAPIVSEEEQKERAEKNKEALRPFYENFKQGEWKDIVTQSLALAEPFKRVEYDKASWAELIRLTEAFSNLYRDLYEWHWYCSAGLGFCFMEWVRLSKEWLNIDDENPVFLKLMAGFDNFAFEGLRELFKVAWRADDLGLKDIFLNNEAKDVVPKLKESGEAAAQWLKEFAQFLDKYGWQSPAHIDLSSPGWVDDPTPAIERIQSTLKEGVREYRLDEILKRQIKEREEEEKRLLSTLPADKRERYKMVMKAGQLWGWWNEEHTNYFEQALNSIGYRHYHSIGKRLCEAGALENPDDTFFLNPLEVIMLLEEPYVYSLKGRVRRRKAWVEECRKIVPPFFIGKIPIDEAMGQVMKSQFVMITHSARGRMPTLEEKERLKADLKGIAGSAGVAEGVARVIMSDEQLDEIQEGDILVAPTTTMSWTPCFSRIKAVVMDSGGVLSHGAIVAREYGIPAVGMTLEGTARIKTGQILRVDGNTGAVYILG